MKKTALTFFLCLLLIKVYSQNIIIDISEPVSEGGTIQACTGINLKLGFSFKATRENKLSLRLDESECSAPPRPVPPGVGNDHNYVYEQLFLSEDESLSLETIQYFDGLGRLSQTVQKGFTPLQRDLVTLQEYDGFGRESHFWLPINTTSQTGAYRDVNNLKTRTDHVYGMDSIYSRMVYEASPLNRVVEEYGPGKQWYRNKKGVKTSYLTNTASGELSCKNFRVGGSGTATSLSDKGVYNAGELFVTRYTDEDGNVSYEFTNKTGQLVLSRQVNQKEYIDTYYVYDDFGNLSYVLPPMMVEAYLNGGASLWDGDHTSRMGWYSYLYKYDGRNRCIKKRIPGCEWIYYVYDDADRLVFSQDGEQRKNKEWSFYKYDKAGRVIISGITTITASDHAGLIDKYKDKVVMEVAEEGEHKNIFGYTWNSMQGDVSASDKILVINHYDNYDHLLDQGLRGTLDYTEKEGYGKCYTGSLGQKSAKGLLTGTRVKVLDEELSTTINTAMYYDYLGNLIQKRSVHTGKDWKHNKAINEYYAYNFAGQVIKRCIEQTYDASSIAYPNKIIKTTEVYAYGYDHAGRLVKTTHQLDGGEEITLEENTYDELGRLEYSYIGNKAETVQYTYNVRSWVNTIKAKNFSQHVYYNEDHRDELYLYNPRYNGNIALVETHNLGMNLGFLNEKKRLYYYEYDNLSRLRYATSCIGGGLEGIMHRYSESFQYDKNGNITSLSRTAPDFLHNRSFVEADNIKFTYTGNQLTKAKDQGEYIASSTSYDFKDYSAGSGQTYLYNANGFLTRDPYKGITVSYNDANLPRNIEIPAIRGTREYVYSATGEKIKTFSRWNPTLSLNPLENTGPSWGIQATRTTLYIGNNIYESGELDKILTQNGYIQDKNYYFYLKDYQGNIRAVIDAKGNTVQQTDYYPSGLPVAEGTAPEEQPYKYNAKEFDTMHGLNMYDYHARQYDVAAARFTSVDPMAEMYYSWSPYAYVMGNPVRYIDPTGMFVDWYKDFDETYQFDPDVKSQTDLLKGQKYIGESFRINGTEYRSDGSIMYNKEKDAYNRIINQSEKTGNENMAILTNIGTLVLPDYKNNPTTVSLSDYNYTTKNGNVIDSSGKEYNTLATVHTHPSGNGPSDYTGTGYGDLGFAAYATPYKPVFVLQMNGKNTVSFIVAPPKDIKNRADVNLTRSYPKANITNLQKGNFSLIEYTQSNNFRKSLGK